MEFKLPDLDYKHDALKPVIDEETMKIHHGKHHAGYVSKLNDALSDDTQFKNKRIEEILSNLYLLPENIRTAVRNNGGGHYNHSIFWQVISPKKGGEPEGKMLELIEQDFGGFSAFKGQFEEAATKRFGSGWAWLYVEDGKLKICSTPNQDNPIMDVVDYAHGVPILGIDVWEHAYYLNYQNKRADYVKAFWDIVNWENVYKLYEQSSEIEALAAHKIAA